ncbi:hypothetical protein [uncultured Aquimarina sp.]|nr:hypothetical protein [uncultured Aquimarina sp.]
MNYTLLSVLQQLSTIHFKEIGAKFTIKDFARTAKFRNNSIEIDKD